MTEPAHSTPETREARVISPHPVGVSVWLFILLLLVVEAGVQWRSQSQSGESALRLVKGESTYVENAALGIRTLRPSTVIKGANQVIATNRYGLRSEDFEPVSPADESRIALLGASTIMGTYAPTNEETSSARLEKTLQAFTPTQRVRVINAGLGGITIRGQASLLSHLLAKLGVKLVLWYPGTNDVSCKPVDHAAASKPWRFNWPGLPGWTLSNELIVKNTAWLRTSKAATNQSLVPSFDLEAMAREVEKGVAAARKAGISLVLVTNATSFRSTMSPERISRRAGSALFFRPCYTGPSLASAVDQVNDMLRAAAAAHSLPLIDAARLMPYALPYYGDSSHFSSLGEARFARLLVDEIERQGIMARENAQ